MRGSLLLLLLLSLVCARRWAMHVKKGVTEDMVHS